MKLPAFFGHKKSINLLPRDAFENSTLGVILEWSLVFGKWAVILTQLVVMGAFLYRFALDRNLTDLRKSIDKNVAIIKSYEQVERDFILAQKQVSSAKVSLAEQELLLKILSDIERITPNEIWYDRVNLTPSTLSLTAYAASLQSFGQFLTAVQQDPLFNGVSISKIESSVVNGAQMQFEIAMSLKGATPQQGKKQ